MAMPFYSRKVGKQRPDATWRCNASLGWEVVQLVGLQILDLAILVRVQASQPILSPFDSAKYSL
jgi:hypothetical protein